MTDQHVHPERSPATTLEKTLAEMLTKIAARLAIDPERVRYITLPEPTSIGVTGERWQIWYRDQWQDLPWHFDGPLCVTRDLVRRWLGVTSVVCGQEERDNT